MTRRKIPHPQCRAIAHAWEVTFMGPAKEAPVELPKVRVYRHWWMVLMVSCMHCGTHRIDYFTNDAPYDRIDPYQVAHRRYVYPEGYRVAGGPVDRSEARRALRKLYG